MVLSVALLLFIGLGKVLGGGGDGKEDDTPQASTVASSPTTTPTGKGRTGGKKHSQPQKPRRTKEPLPQPSGPCVDSDVVVTPKIARAQAGAEVSITLLVTSKISEACTFAISPDSFVLKMTSGDDRIWTSQQCPGRIPKVTVIARQEVPGRAVMTWSGRRSNEDCTPEAGWALPGYYHAVSAALGADATDVQFELGPAIAATITPKPKIKRVKNR